jgi:AcrR family transcriptional regulator
MPPTTTVTEPYPPHLLDTAADAALALAEERLWADITLRDIAVAAGVAFADLYAKAPGKAALLERLSARYDRAALTTAELEPAADPHDRLFEAVMARLEAMAPHRAALIAIARSEGLAALGPRLPRTARALLEASGVDTGGLKGAVRVAAMTAVWTRILVVWRDDEGALNRTMAEIDMQLKRMRRGLERVRAGY